MAEGTIYTLLVRIEQRGLVDVEKVPSDKGPPRKVYSVNAQGQEYLQEFWRTWSFLAERLEHGDPPLRRGLTSPRAARPARPLAGPKRLTPAPCRSHRCPCSPGEAGRR
ncbi:PadR family transcriptional regulator [Spongiactinospora sp. 9N601]|uniref:PadR family transcriptional regulator n=1 Tax=Spongiactinospora sp. 9N601 TaxID=3375149 RepID=UPI00378B39D7